MTFDWSTHVRRAPGSDNWAITWADDDHQYATWGDGGGFGGTNALGRVSFGVARIEGGPLDYRGHNVWGGAATERPATFSGKSYGILSLDGILYLWRCGSASEATAYEFQQLYRSADHGASWASAGVEFDPSSFSGRDRVGDPGGDRGFFCPTFLQFGRDYADARDEYVYAYAPEIQSLAWDVQVPGEIALFRAPRGGLADRSRYEFFAGLDPAGSPRWTSDVGRRRPAFEDRANGVMRASVSYNAGLGRYLLVTEHTRGARGNIGIFEAPRPWGPWRTVLFAGPFGAPVVPPSTFFWNFANKWLSPDGTRFVLVFSGRGPNDSWNSVSGEFIVGGAHAPREAPLAPVGARVPREPPSARAHTDG